MQTVVRKTWRELSEAAAREQDPEKLLQLVEELNQALEEEENQLKRQYSRHPESAPTSHHHSRPLLGTRVGRAKTLLQAGI
jgi:hypothetical protein